MRFEDWTELRRYCYNVAGTVGLMTLPVMGVAEGYTVEDAVPAGVDLGIALQLTNILRDVGEEEETNVHLVLNLAHTRSFTYTY